MGLLDFFGDSDNTTPSSYSMLPAGGGVLASGSPSYFELNMFGGPSTVPDGGRLIDQRANTSFFTFDQSKVSASVFDIMKSGVEAAARVGVQVAADSINRNANNKSITGSFLNNFRSTKTGAQVNAAAMATRAESFFMNPTVWLVSLVGLVGIVLLVKR